MSRRAIFLLAMTCAAQTLSTGDRQLNVDSFEKVWQTVRDKHWDLASTGVNWQAVHDELRPKIDTTKSMGEAREVMNDMLERLKQTHFGIMPSEIYKDIEQGATGTATPGIDVRILDGRALVTKVEPESSAARKGVKTGWEIVKVGDREVAPVLRRIAERYKG